MSKKDLKKDWIEMDKAMLRSIIKRGKSKLILEDMYDIEGERNIRV